MIRAKSGSRRHSVNLFLVSVALTTIISSANAAAPAGCLHTTQEDMWTALKTDDGILFVGNRAGLHFTLSVKGKDIRPMNDPNNIFFVVDGLILQIQSLPISNFAPNARKNKLDDRAILLAHRDWESGFLETELLHTKITVKSASEKLSAGIDALIWQYDLPDNLKNPEATGQMYLTRVAQDHVILLNVVINPTVTESAARRFLVDTIATLKISQDRIDVKKLQEAIQKGP
jgi:hypothetical protein